MRLRRLTRNGPATIPALLLLLASAARADDPCLGDRVITRQGAQLMIGRRVIPVDRSEDLARSEIQTTFRVYRVADRVTQANDRWLWLVAETGGPRGWVKPEWVITLEQAIDEDTRRIRADPLRAPSYNHRGNLWRSKREYGIALADFDVAILLMPDEAMYHNNRGVVRNARNEYTEAITSYDEAIRLDPFYSTAYFNRGLARQAKTAAAKDSARNHGVVRDARKEYAKVLHDFDMAIRLEPHYVAAYLSRAAARLSEREYAGAIADYNEALRLDPDSVDACDLLARLLSTCPDLLARDGGKAVKSTIKTREPSE